MDWSNYLEYDESTPSCLRWKKVTSFRVTVGAPAGNLRKDGYYRVGLGLTSTRAHRIIWELHNGPVPKGMFIDHKDMDKSNNTISNLRLATKSGNSCNRTKGIRNKSGYKGVCWDTRKGKWLAQIQYNKKNKFLGYFDLPQDAAIAYNTAAAKFHGEFARSE